MSFKSINPYTNEVVANYVADTAASIEKKLGLGHQQFLEFQHSSLDLRKSMMLSLVKHLEDHADEHAAIIVTEMGKTHKEAKAEVLKCAATAKYYVEHIAEMLQPKPLPSDDSVKSYISYEAKGIILAIMPWNFPFWQVFRFAIPNILAGNTAVLKHASNVSGCALAIEQIFLDAGFPPGTFQTLLVSSKDIEPVIADVRVQGVTITGSTPAGMSVASLAGKYLKKSVLELGGSDPFIVLKDADIAQAAKVAVQARMQNAGQSCIAAKRWIVEKSILAPFTEQVTNIIQNIKQGDPTSTGTDMGPMARLDLANDLMKQLQQSIRQGAKLVTGGQQQGCNVLPALLTGVQPGMTAFDEETFGPLAAITSANDEAHAIQLANTTNFGLGASLWTNDLEKAAALAKRIESGNVFVNAMVRSDARLPFGGIKQSGYGRELSEVGAHEFLNIKTVYLQE